MNKTKPILPLVLTIIFIIVFLWLVFILLKIPIDANFFVALATLIVGFGAIYLYVTQRVDSKKDAAKIIIQEIRRAEDIIAEYKRQGNFNFTQKIIANNSWGKNIHFFVGNLDPDELDKISNLYSTAEFLDNVISKVFDWRFNDASKRFYGEVKDQTISIPVPQQQIFTQSPGLPTPVGTPQQFIPLQIPRQADFWVQILNEIVLKYEPIYHSPIVENLKKIADL